MTQLLHHLVESRAASTPLAEALRHKGHGLAYGDLFAAIERCAFGLIALGLAPRERVAIFLAKQFESVIGMFGSARAGLTFVPVNPLLKAPQVQHILNDCAARVLVTSADRLSGLLETFPQCPQLRHIVLVDTAAASPSVPAGLHLWHWQDWLLADHPAVTHRAIDMDMAAILYTSGSTGRPKGVVLSHRNLVTGAHSVSQYLQNTAEDRLLAVLPFSFDYGFSQLSTAFHVGASVVLMDYLFPRDILQLAERERITGLAGVPPLWTQLAELPWPASVGDHLRYLTNSGGALPQSTLQRLRSALPKTRVFLMYGLTEAFRSTYLPPEELERRPGSMGKAIPNAEILVVRPDGSPCAPDEPGELVHRGSLVALGYWNDTAKTQERFRPAPGQASGLPLPELAVWSGDTVRKDADGYLYFIGRRDEMIKTSGYRVSPTEIEEILFATGLVADAAAIGVAHPSLGQIIVVVAAPMLGQTPDTVALLHACRRALPAYMVPARIEWRDALPRNPNGKYDRARLAAELNPMPPASTS
jgi:acyl-CoA ligase (AMP-forming) (exosortase A-associated)